MLLSTKNDGEWGTEYRRFLQARNRSASHHVLVLAAPRRHLVVGALLLLLLLLLSVASWSLTHRGSLFSKPLACCGRGIVVYMYAQNWTRTSVRLTDGASDRPRGGAGSRLQGRRMRDPRLVCRATPLEGNPGATRLPLRRGPSFVKG